ncbi:hypothetical protein, partial [Actinomycetospora straminea]
QRPLDDREARAFDEIVQGYRRTARRRPAEPGAPRLRWRTVVLVLAAASVFALVTALLPAPANLWSPVVALVAVAIASVVWAVRAHRRDGRP